MTAPIEDVSSLPGRKVTDQEEVPIGEVKEICSDNKSYATLVSEEEGTAKRVEDVDELETPNADTRTDESKERLQNAGSAETRDVDAGAIADQNAENGGEAEDD